MSLESLAERHGHRWKTLWEDPNNEHLRKECRSPHALAPGDVVFIPPPRRREHAAGTELLHRFRINRGPSRFKMRFVVDGEPRADQPCTVEVDGEERSETTDGDGVLDIEVAVDAKEVRVRFEPMSDDAGPVDTTFDDDPPEPAEVGGVGEDVYRFRLRCLEPSDLPRGAQARLRALGYDPGKLDGVLGPRSRDALRSYQQDAGIEPTGELDGDTISSLSGVIPG